MHIMWLTSEECIRSRDMDRNVWTTYMHNFIRFGLLSFVVVVVVVDFFSVKASKLFLQKR